MLTQTFVRVAMALTVLAATASAAHDDMQGLDTVTPDGVTIVHREDGIVFADPDGLTLYRYDEDANTPGGSCYGERHCQRRWPPLHAPSRSAGVVGQWSVIERRDGTLQWAYKGSPVYTSSEDRTPGVMSGDNARQAWHALFQPYAAPEPAVPPGVAVKRVGNHWVFADSQDRLLYFPKELGESGFGCVDDCLYRWTPFPAPILAGAIGDWTIETRADGRRQWSYRNKPAYVLRQPDVEGSISDVPGWSPLVVLGQ